MNKFKLSEDWTATIVGGLFIILSIIAFKFIGLNLGWPTIQWATIDDLIHNVFALNNLLAIGMLFIISYLAILLITKLQGKRVQASLGYPFLFLSTFTAMVIAGNSFFNKWGFEAVIFSLLIGLFVNNVFGIKLWMKESLSSELYVKIGLIFLGSSVLFQDLLEAGILGILQSVIVVFSVWYFSFWLCRKFKIDKEMSMMLSSAVSICGVSAAIATAGAIKGDSKKLSFVVSLVLIVALPMIFIMPALAKLLDLNETIAGAWIGGTIDTTAAVAATASVYGEEALKISTIVKFSQNVLLGLAAFIIAIYWSYTQKEKHEFADKPSLKLIWERFPKFVLGFIAVSLLFSFALPSLDYQPVKKSLKNFQNFWFALGFTAIGLETNFKAFITQENKKATAAFICAQIFNVLITLFASYLIFGKTGS